MGCSACKCVRRRRPLAITVLLMLLVSGCSGRDPRELERQRAEKAQQELTRQRCARDRRVLPPLLAALSNAEERVAAIAAEGYVPSPGPKPLDPSEQERLAVYDQEVEQEQYNQALAAWQEREQQRESLWRRDRRGRLADARDRRDAAAADLQRLYPSLLDPGPPPRLRGSERDRLLACGTGAR